LSSNEVGMMRALFFVLVLLISVCSSAQTIPKFNGSYVSSPLESIILDLEEQFQIEFFYDHNWIDTVQISRDFVNAPLDTVLYKVEIGYIFLTRNQSLLSLELANSSIVSQTMNRLKRG
jgi:hypothetical protein